MNQIDQLIQRLLVVRSQLGERAALEELFVRHNRALSGSCAILRRSSCGCTRSRDEKR
jgi:hypothetical protein